MSPLLETLAAELGRPRDLTAQVLHHLIETYGITREEVGAFLANELSNLEDYEIDLIFSPLFTPTLRDQAVFADLLGRDSILPGQWPALVRELDARPVRGQFGTSDGQTHSVELREVTIERFVHRLRLDATIPESLFNLINRVPPAEGRSLLKAVARRAVWESEPRRDILVQFLSDTVRDNDYRLDDLLDLLKLTETYQPTDVKELLGQIPHWQQVLRQEINEAASPKPFFNERVEELHGGGRDQRRQDRPRITAMEKERAFLERLEKVLAGRSAGVRSSTSLS